MFHAIPLAQDTRIYRSYTDSAKQTGFWYSLNAPETYGYGAHTAEFRITRPINLIDIAHPTFYDNLKLLIRDVSRTNARVKDTRHELLFPLGFDDRLLYHATARVLSLGHIDPSSFPLKYDIQMTSLLEFNNKSRCSIHTYDVKLLEFLRDNIGHLCDGIISPIEFPDTIRNGYQPPELSVFDTSCLEFVGDVPRPVIGGGEMKYLPPIKLDIPENKYKPGDLKGDLTIPINIVYDAPYNAPQTSQAPAKKDIQYLPPIKLDIPENKYKPGDLKGDLTIPIHVAYLPQEGSIKSTPHVSSLNVMNEFIKNTTSIPDAYNKLDAVNYRYPVKFTYDTHLNPKLTVRRKTRKIHRK